MTAFPWTDEQKAVLASTDRITLVQAGPGSGKTKVFAEIVDSRLRSWPHRIGGLAALSFTNVARGEIEDRVCAATVAPHFVGTLDAFFLRFVIGPFGHLAGLPKSGARLIPSPLDQQLDGPTIKVADKLFPTIFQITATGGTEATPEFQYRMPNGFSAGAVPDSAKGWALSVKRKEWQSRGRVTHGDCSYLASCILKGPHGPSVRAILARRFPVICIDEFQDTGHFLGRAVLSLLAEPAIQSLVVGDIDQKIFGFSGVSPNLFADVAKLTGAKLYPLQISQRCAGTVCAVATQLSRSVTTVVPAEKAILGQALLAKHNDKLADIDAKLLDRALSVASDSGCATVAVLVRKRITKTKFLRTVAKSGPSVGCRGVEQIVNAIDGLKEGRGRHAVDVAQALVCRILFGDDRPTDDGMRAAGVEPSVLRRHVRRLLLQVIDAKPPETWGEWRERTKGLCDKVAQECGITTHKQRLGASFKASKGDKPDVIRTVEAKKTLPSLKDLAVEVLTVHEAKGREFDAVVFYCPQPTKPGGGSTCPSDNWWASAATSEEKEVAFVAVTRARKLLVLAVHEKTWTALDGTQKPFVSAFAPLPEGAAMGEGQPMWVFGYGSLMWDGWEARFNGSRVDGAVLPGYSRSFNKKSTQNWGSPSSPAPTLGLEPSAGGQCIGTAFEFTDDKRDLVIEYLKGREGAAFKFPELPVNLPDARTVQAVTPVNSRKHNTYLGAVPLVDRAKMATAAKGTSGACVDYARNLQQRLQDLGIADAAVAEFVASIGGTTDR